jgi:hypothetical protein
MSLRSLEGRLRHCIRYKTGKGGRKVCAKYRAGPGKPKGRKKAGIKRRFVERSTTKKRAHRTCAKWGKSNGRRVCRKWRHSSRKKLPARQRKCLKWGTNKIGRRTCVKYRVKGNGRRRTGKKNPLYGVKRRCIRKGKNRLGRTYCKEYAKARSGAQMWNPGSQQWEGFGFLGALRQSLRMW